MLRWAIPLALFVLLASAIWYFTGFYSIPPIGALPEGSTIIVWRTQGAPYFDSPDGACLRTQNGVSLLCRGIALAKSGVVDRVILKLPYQEWAYLASTDGKTFEQ